MPRRFTFEFVRCEDKVLDIDEAVEIYGQRMVEYCSDILMVVEVKAENYHEAKEKILELMKQIIYHNANSPTSFI